MKGDSTSSYWLNWRFLVCLVWLLLSMNIAFMLIWKRKKEGEGFVYEDQAWMPCLKAVHPAWLLAFRLCAFAVLLFLLVAIVLVDGAVMFYYYTQWTLTLVTLYFAMGSLISICGCYKLYHKMAAAAGSAADLDAGHGGGERCKGLNSACSQDNNEQVEERRQPAGKWGYAFQIIFQVNGGAVMLTDTVFWFVIFPFMAVKDKRLNVLIVSMHSMNAIFLLGETAMNSLPFPFFRIAYFILWTIIYVLFQWILHASAQIWWPYPFLDISSPSAPLWYLAVAVIHLPSYAFFAFLVKLKNAALLSRPHQQLPS